jgi:hypothetical protein
VLVSSIKELERAARPGLSGAMITNWPRSLSLPSFRPHRNELI